MSSNRKNWKKVSSRRAKLWKKVNGDFTPVPPSVKIMLLVTVILIVVLVSAFGYYQNDVSPYLPRKTTPILECAPATDNLHPSCVQKPDVQAPDPFSTLFDGRINGISGNTPVGGWGPIQYIQSASSGSCTLASGTCSVTLTPLRTADTLVVVVWGTFQCQNSYNSIYSDPNFGTPLGGLSTPCFSLSDTQGLIIVNDACSPRLLTDGSTTTLAQYYECIFRVENLNAFTTEMVTATKQGTLVSTGQSIMGLTLLEYEGISSATLNLQEGDANGILIKNVGSASQFSTSLSLHPIPTLGSVLLDPSVTVCNNLNGKVTGCFHSNAADLYTSITIYTNGTILLDLRGFELQEPSLQVSNHITTYGNGTFDIRFQATQPSPVTSSNAKNGTPLYANGMEKIQYTTNQVSDLILTFITQTNLNLPLNNPTTGITIDVGSNSDAQVAGTSSCNEGSWSAPVITRVTTGYLTCEVSIGDDFSFTLPLTYNSYLLNQTTTSMLIVRYQTNGLAPCGRSYMCSFALADSSGEFELYPTATNPGVVMTNSTVDLSTAINRALAFNEVAASCNPTDNLCSGGNDAYYPGEMFGFFLRLNSTLPSEAGWSPLTDSSVTLLVMYYVQDPGAGTNNAIINFYVYIQRQLGSLLSVGSLNPISNCTNESTLYFCHGTTQNNHPSLLASVLNFTGGALNVPISNTNGASRSYFCTDWGSGNNANGCILGGSGSTSVTYLNTKVWNATNVPWLNLQGAYHIGFWMAPNPVTSVDWKTIFETSSSFDVGNIVSIYYPPTQIVKSNSDQSFLGWLGHTFGAVVNSVGNAFKAAGSTIQNGLSWVQNTALGPIGDVLQGMVSWMVNQVVNFLNWVGSGFGFPTLGTALFTLFAELTSIIIKTLLNFVTWVANTTTFILNALVFAVNIFANSIIFGLLAFVVGPMLTLLNIILTVITLFFSFAAPTSYLLLMDWAWGIMMVYVIGVSGFLWWVDINVQIFTFVFKMIHKFTTLVWWIIVTIKSFIPTEGGTPGNLADPTPGGGPKGGSGSGGKPETKKEVPKKEDKKEEKEVQRGAKVGGKIGVPPRGYGQGAKDGDPFAIMVMGFMIVVVLFWLSQAAFSPISSVSVVGCGAWSTNCHVQNGVRVGNIDTTVFFAYLFNQQHGVFIIFTLFVPLVIVMFAYWFMKNVVGEDKARGNDFLNIGGTVNRTPQRTASSRQETLRRLRSKRRSN